MVRGVVLNRYKQGETSCILRIFTDELGLIGVYVRGGMKKPEIPEIGDVVEGNPTRRSSEGMFSLYQFSVLEKYAFFANLEVHTFRDIIFELLWKTLPEEHPEEELYDVLTRCLAHFQKDEDEVTRCYFYLWLFLYRYTELVGFNLDLTHCSICGSVERPLGLGAKDREVVCSQCQKGITLFPDTVKHLLHGGVASDVILSYTKRQRVGVTRMMLEYIESHLTFPGKINGLTFLEEIELGTVDT